MIRRKHETMKELKEENKKERSRAKMDGSEIVKISYIERSVQRRSKKAR
jgi:hypothetical protein